MSVRHLMKTAQAPVPVRPRRGLMLLSVIAVVSALCVPAEAAEARLMRFPDIHGREVAFSYGGELWSASIDGGLARQLTSGPGLKLFPKYSSDGRWIAFTGQYGGDEQVYVIPSEGGVPRQLTFYPARGPLPARYGYDNQVTGWTPDGSAVVFRSLRDVSAPSQSRLYTVPAAGGDVAALPMARAGAGVFSPDGGKVLFSTTSQDFRTWKRYQGGLAQDLFVADLGSKTLTNITRDPRTDRDPMWTTRGIYFLSDRDGRLNLYHQDEPSSAPRQLTHFTQGDAAFASADAGGDVVFQYEGSLQVYEAATGQTRVLEIELPASDEAARPRTVKVGDQIEKVALSPDGERLAVIARGDLFVVPAGREGAVVNLTNSSTAHDREAAWSPDGRTIAYLSDAGGEEELWTISADGGSAKQITRGNTSRYSRPLWSPDGRRIAYLDKDGDLFVVDVATGARRKAGATKAWYQQDYAWSPDSRYLAFVEMQPTNFRTIRIWDGSTGAEAAAVTDPLYDSWNPTWSPDGRYLWFQSVRDVNLQMSETDWNFAPSRQTRLYLLTLQDDTANPFGAENGGRNAASGAADADRHTNLRDGRMRPIQFAGLAQRLIRAPLKPDNYADLTATSDGLLYRIEQPRFFGENDVTGDLYIFSLKNGQASRIREDVADYDRAIGDGRVLLRDKAGKRALAHLDGDLKIAGEAQPVVLDALTSLVVPRQEWATIFSEAWRRYRDFFYDPQMHGHDWKAVRDHYERLLPAVGTRADLNYLIGEMIGELNISHAYVGGGQESLPDRPKTGLIGARFTFDRSANVWRIARILEGDNGDPLYRSPLTEVGVGVRSGDALLSVDGRVLDADTSPYLALAGKAGRVVELGVRRDGSAARRVQVETLDTEAPLIRFNETLEARRLVDRLSNGRIGYVHISDMDGGGLKEFVKDWYGQIRKDGMIIDIRGNAGGRVSRMILERLVRPAYTRGFVRGLQIPQTYPWGGYTQVFTGEMAMLVDETTMSDGDTMAWTFQQTRRGPLIGRRTWGGVIGAGDTGPMLDGGLITVPQFALTGPNGEWIIEGEGVTPDIDVDLDQPALKGLPDAQITAAVDNILSRLSGRPGDLGGPQPYPVKP